MKNVVLNSLIFPDNGIPKCFSNVQLYNNLNNIRVKYGDVYNLLNHTFEINDNKIRSFKGYKDINIGVMKGTEPILFRFSKNDNSLRCLSIPNPLVQISLNWYLDKNIEFLLNMQLNDSDRFISNTKFYIIEDYILMSNWYDEGEILIDDLSQKDYREGIISKHIVSDGKYYQMYVDISNFYNSIYSHLLSWDIYDKQQKDIMNNIDILTRNTNSGETKGILIGPYTSSFISELLLSRIDKSINDYIQSNNLDVSYMRFCDDYYFYSDSKELLENKVKYILEKELEKYKLVLNSDKIIITEFPFLELATQNSNNIYLWEQELLKMQNDELQIIENIINEINISLKSGISSCKYLLKVLTDKIGKKKINISNFNKENINVLLDYLINTMFKYNILSETISLLIIKIMLYNNNLDKLYNIKKWINKYQTRKSHLRECISIWIAFIILNFNIDSEEINTFFNDLLNDNDLGTILTLEYYHKYSKVIKHKKYILEKLNNIDIELIEKFGNKPGQIWFSKYWLIMYINETRWNLNLIQGFKSSIINKSCLDKIADIELKNRIHLFYTMKELNIKLFIMPYDKK